MHRTQIYLTDEEEAALDRVAKKSRRSRSQLIREAIDTTYLRAPIAQDLEQALLTAAGAWRRARTGEQYVERLRRGRLAALHSGK